MSADFDKPGLDDPYTEVLPDIRDNQKSLATMFNTGAAFNTPLNAVQFLGGKFSLFNGASFDITPVAVAGGGTGATTAAGARANLSLSSVSEANALYLKVLSNGSDIDDVSLFRTNIVVYSKSETDTADNLRLLKTDNLASVASALASFNNIKQNATVTLKGVVEQANPSEMRGGAADKFPDAATIVADRVPVSIWTGNEPQVSIAEILASSGFVVVPGLYWVEQAGGSRHSVSVSDITNLSHGSAASATDGSGDISVTTLRYDTTLGFWIILAKQGVVGSTTVNAIEIFFSPL